MFNKSEVMKMISAGKKLILAGDEETLRGLPAGTWIAGTIPYFMGAEGGVFSKEEIFVTELPDYVLSTELKVYDENNIHQVYYDAPRHGFSVIIIPTSSKTHFTFALSAPSFEGFATRPLIGWIAGVVLGDDTAKAKVYRGSDGLVLENGAVVMHVELPMNKVAEIDIVNIFEQGNGDTITFPEDGFAVSTAMINGVPRNFADLHYREQYRYSPGIGDGSLWRHDQHQFQEPVILVQKQVNLYAPVFAGYKYKIAKPWMITLIYLLPKSFQSQRQSGLCMQLYLNYLYAGLEVEKLGTSLDQLPLVKLRINF
jgi:hypothetical protein